MSEQFLKWFEQYFESIAVFTDEEKEEVKTYTWLAWRDSNRKETEKL